MIIQEDKNILQDVGKQYLLNISYTSPLIKSRLSFKEHIELCKCIDELSYKEVIGLTITESVRDFESKFSKFLKYGFAQVAGMAAGFKAAKGGGGFARLGGALLGPPIAMFILYTYRKLTDTCSRACSQNKMFSTQRKICRYDCQARAALKIANTIRGEIGRCNATSNPESCKKKLQQQHIMWVKRVQQQKTKLAKAKIGIEAMARRKKDVEMQQRMKTVQASFKIPKDKLIDLISENEYLRENITFKQHLKIYHTVLNLKEEDDPIVKGHVINPNKEKNIRYALYAGLWIVPIPFFNDAVNYLIKKNNVKCIAKCIKQRKYSQKLCKNQCTYLSARTAIDFLKKELPKCQKSKKPVKCQHKIQNMLGDWKQREIEARMKYKNQLDIDLRDAKEREQKTASKQ